MYYYALTVIESDISNLKGNSMFKKGNLIRVKDDSDGPILRVIFEGATEEDSLQVEYEDGVKSWFDPDEIELVAESLEEYGKVKNPQPLVEQTIAIVSFEGAVKREVKALREAIKCCDSVSYFQLVVTASGAVNDGEVNIEYRITDSSYGSGGVSGNNVKECLSEFLRRHGWDQTNKPIAISYDGIPT